MRRTLVIALVIGVAAVAIIEAARAQGKDGPPAFLKDSGFDGCVTFHKDYGETVVLMFSRACTIFWERQSCDTQRDGVASMYLLYKKARPNAHTVTVWSDTGRSIGQVKRTVFSGFKYHCGD